MQTAGLTPDNRASAPALAAALRPIFTGLATLIARAFLKDPRHVGIILLLWNRLNRAARRFDRLMDRVAAGTERPRPARATPSATGAAPLPASRPAPQRLPARKAWLLAALKHEAAFYHNRLVALLDRPGAAATLAAVPQAVSLLRPLCHMLGVDHPAIPPRPRRRQAAPAAPVPAPALPRPAIGATAPAFPAADERPFRSLADSAPCEHVGWPWFPGRFSRRA